MLLWCPAVALAWCALAAGCGHLLAEVVAGAAGPADVAAMLACLVDGLALCGVLPEAAPAVAAGAAGRAGAPASAPAPAAVPYQALLHSLLLELLDVVSHCDLDHAPDGVLSLAAMPAQVLPGIVALLKTLKLGPIHVAVLQVRACCLFV